MYMECSMKRSTPMDRNIGAKVQYYRNQLNLTQKELAARLQVNGCDLSEVMVAQIEIGYRAVSVFEIDKLAEVLHVDYNALFAQD
jgi:transcriptional regulator with XRE-family HTH domain